LPCAPEIAEIVEVYFARKLMPVEAQGDVIVPLLREHGGQARRGGSQSHFFGRMLSFDVKLQEGKGKIREFLALLHRRSLREWV
jgi:hypothetical protein